MEDDRTKNSRTLSLSEAEAGKWGRCWWRIVLLIVRHFWTAKHVEAALLKKKKKKGDEDEMSFLKMIDR